MTNHICMAVILKPKPNHPYGSVQKSKDQKTHVKWGQIWRFCSLFSSLAMARCIMNSSHIVVRSVKNTTLKLCADCLKQFVRNAQNRGETSHRFCNMIMYQFTYRCLCVSFWHKKKQNRNHASITFFFPKQKTLMNGKRFLRLRRMRICPKRS